MVRPTVGYELQLLRLPSQAPMAPVSLHSDEAARQLLSAAVRWVDRRGGPLAAPQLRGKTG